MKRTLLPFLLITSLAAPAFAGDTFTFYSETTDTQLRLDRMENDDSNNPDLLAPAHKPGDTGNKVNLNQRGNGNSAALSQSGLGNTLSVLQLGDGGTVDVDQSGVGKRTVVIQFNR